MSLLTLEASDRFNPIVVKEVRQGLRTRTFVASFLVLLVICVLIALFAWAANAARLDEEAGVEGGQQVFLFIFACLSFVSFFVVPFNAYRSLVAERSEETWSTLILTRLTARQILRGKIASSLVQSALYASAAGPFMLFSYFLQGVSLAFILTCLVLGAAFQTFLILLSVCLATFAPTGNSRQLSFFGLLILLFAAFSILTGQLSDAARSPASFLSAEAFEAYAVIFALLGSAGAVLFELAAGRLSPSNVNSAKGPRVALFIHLLVVVAGIACASRTDIGKWVVLALPYGSCWILFLGLFGVSGPAAPPPALRTKSPLHGLIVPGALNAWRFSMLMFWLWAAVLYAYNLQGKEDIASSIFLAIPALSTIYLGVPSIGRAAIKRWSDTGVSVRVMFLLTIVLFGMAPSIIAVAVDSHTADPAFFVLNPVMLLIQSWHPTSAWKPDATEWMSLVQILAAVAVVITADGLLRMRAEGEQAATT